MRADRSEMQPAPSAVRGHFARDVTLMSEPIPASPGTVGFLTRRSLEASKLFDILVSRGVPCFLDLSDRKATPYLSLLAIVPRVLKAAREAFGLMVLPTVEAFAQYLYLIKLSAPMAGCAKTIVAALDGEAPLSEFNARVEANFNVDACRRVSIMTAHATKGLTFETVYIVQPGLFPLIKAVEEGEMAAQQEANLLYVAMTRATLNLFLLKNAEVGETDTMEATLFEL